MLTLLVEELRPLEEPSRAETKTESFPLCDIWRPHLVDLQQVSMCVASNSRSECEHKLYEIVSLH